VTPTQKVNTAAEMAESWETPPSNLGGRRLFVARALWVAVVSLRALIFAASVPAHLVDLHRICAAEPCVARQLAPGDRRALGDLGFSLDVYAAYVFALDLVALGFCAVGAVIFWRKSRERGALFVSFALIRLRPISSRVGRSGRVLDPARAGIPVRVLLRLSRR
jgi:hypothetical protein